MGKCGSSEALSNTRFRTRVVVPSLRNGRCQACLNEPHLHSLAAGLAAPNKRYSSTRNKEHERPSTDRTRIPEPAAGEEAGLRSALAL
jgi:hypothetical protein